MYPYKPYQAEFSLSSTNELIYSIALQNSPEERSRWNAPQAHTEKSLAYATGEALRYMWDNVIDMANHIWGKMPFSTAQAASISNVAKQQLRSSFVSSLEAPSAYSKLLALPRLTGEELSEKFEFLDMLPDVGQAIQFTVRDKSTQEKYVFLVESYIHKSGFPLRERLFRLMMEAKNPHIFKERTSFWLENEDFPWKCCTTLFKKHGKANQAQALREAIKEEEAQEFYPDSYVTVLPPEGITVEKGVSTDRIDPKIAAIQQSFYNFFLWQYQFYPSELESYLVVPTEDIIGEEPSLNKFHYWCYRFGEELLYVPRQEYTLLFVPYGVWGSDSPLFKVDSDAGLHEIEKIAKKFDLTTAEFKNLYARPDNIPDSQIWYIGDEIGQGAQSRYYEEL